MEMRDGALTIKTIPQTEFGHALMLAKHLLLVAFCRVLNVVTGFFKRQIQIERNVAADLYGNVPIRTIKSPLPA